MQIGSAPPSGCAKIAKTAARARRRLHRREAGRRFCAIVDASALSRGGPARGGLRRPGR
ncbi:hypothetical protein IE979_04340 [Klebsiella pneumoniae]|uniref:Uncharacterized protein n=1 Tax=Klebsiella pneumoniae TaxID=573 RepID=A0A927DPI5_KLEPN|nr:hypothetical protein [Klebsiella pneumoniae]MBD3715744.1 hypothetical protein [Klebsiella pneumoniae]